MNIHAEQENDNELAVLMISCDEFSDCWTPFFDCFFKFWPDCPYPVYIGVNNKVFKYDKNGNSVITIQVGGNGKLWANNVNKMLDHIPQNYILNFMEEYFFRSKVNQSSIDEYFAIAKRYNLDCLRLNADPRGSKRLKEPKGFYEVKATDDYCIVTTPSIWKKDSFRITLKPDYDVRHYEILNAKEYNEDKYMPLKIWTTKNFNYDFFDSIGNGKWRKEVIVFLKENDIQLDSKREIKSNAETIAFHLNKFLRKFVPKAIKRKVREKKYKHYFESQTYKNYLATKHK